MSLPPRSAALAKTSAGRPNRRKGSLKRDAATPAAASAIPDESRLALP